MQRRCDSAPRNIPAFFRARVDRPLRPSRFLRPVRQQTPLQQIEVRSRILCSDFCRDVIRPLVDKYAAARRAFAELFLFSP